jgi:hypothetical protein
MIQVKLFHHFHESDYSSRSREISKPYVPALDKCVVEAIKE